MRLLPSITMFHMVFEIKITPRMVVMILNHPNFTHLPSDILVDYTNV